MIQIIGVRLIGIEHPQRFELGYKDFQEDTDKGCLVTTKYGTEPVLRTAMKNSGVDEAVIEALFQNAVKCVQR
jgi:hypothetical protein